MRPINPKAGITLFIKSAYRRTHLTAIFILASLLTSQLVTSAPSDSTKSSTSTGQPKANTRNTNVWSTAAEMNKAFASKATYIDVSYNQGSSSRIRPANVTVPHGSYVVLRLSGVNRYANDVKVSIRNGDVKYTPADFSEYDGVLARLSGRVAADVDASKSRLTNVTGSTGGSVTITKNDANQLSEQSLLKLEPQNVSATEIAFSAQKSINTYRNLLELYITTLGIASKYERILLNSMTEKSMKEASDKQLKDDPEDLSMEFSRLRMALDILIKYQSMMVQSTSGDAQEVAKQVLSSMTDLQSKLSTEVTEEISKRAAAMRSLINSGNVFTFTTPPIEATKSFVEFEVTITPKQYSPAALLHQGEQRFTVRANVDDVWRVMVSGGLFATTSSALTSVTTVTSTEGTFTVADAREVGWSTPAVFTPLTFFYDSGCWRYFGLSLGLGIDPKTESFVSAMGGVSLRIPGDGFALVLTLGRSHQKMSVLNPIYKVGGEAVNTSRLVEQPLMINEWRGAWLIGFSIGFN